MDINTEAGQVTLRDEQRAWSIFEDAHKGFHGIQTPKDKPSDVDGFIVKDKIIISVVEVKCRYNITYADFCSKFNNEWLVTFEKLENARRIARGLCVSVTGFLFLVDEDILLIQKISDMSGYIPNMRIERTETQTTVNNSNMITRTNAFIDMTNARVINNGF